MEKLTCICGNKNFTINLGHCYYMIFQCDKCGGCYSIFIEREDDMQTDSFIKFIKPQAKRGE